MIAVMAVGGVLCFAPMIRAHFFPSVENGNYTVSRGACLILMLSTALVAIYTLSTSDLEDFEFTTLNGIFLANIILAFTALFFSGWLIPAIAIALVVMECAFTGSVAIVAKSFHLVFLVGIVTKLAYLAFSLQLDRKAYLHRGIRPVRQNATITAL